MDLGGLWTRVRERWSTALGILVAAVLIGGSLAALNDQVFPFTSWPVLSTQPDSSEVLPSSPPATTAGGGRSGGAPGAPARPGGAAPGAPIAPLPQTGGTAAPGSLGGVGGG